MAATWRSRRVAALVAGLAVVVVAGCTSGSPTPTTATETGATGGDVIVDFARAWAEPETAEFRGIVDEPGIAARDIEAYEAELGINETDVEMNDDLDCTSDSCRQRATVTHDLAGVGEWSYETLIKAELNQGQWLVEWSPGTFHPDLTEVTTLVLRRDLPSRAPIVDRSGIALTPELAIVRIGVQPSKVRPRTYVELADLLDIDYVALRDRVLAAQPEWFVPVIDLRRQAYAPLRTRLLQVPGISIDTARRALAPTAEWGRAVLGTVGPATKESLRAAGALTLPTDEVGVSGLQRAYEEELAGTPGASIDLVEKVTGDVLNQVWSRKPVAGNTLKTSLDFDVQNAAEKAIARASQTTSVVVVKASTGEILAAANAPGPTSYNTAFIGRYAPGSTFKVVSTATLIGAGVVTPRTPVECPDTTVVSGKEFKNYDDGITGPNPTFADAFAASCNTTIVDRADNISGPALARTARQFGMGATWEVGLPAFSGSVPADADLVTRAADMIGQGKVEASPLAMAMVAASIDSGVSRTPTLLPGLLSGTRLEQLDVGTVDDLQQLMRLVVTDGTGQSVDLSGPPVYAKTGTAEFADGRRIGTNAWMIGFRGDIAFAVLVENGSSGAHDAAPVVTSLLANLPNAVYR